MASIEERVEDLFKKRLKLPEECDATGRGHKIWPQSIFDREMYAILNDIEELNRLENELRKYADEPLGDAFMNTIYDYSKTAEWIARNTMTLRYYLCDFCGYDEVEEE